MSKYVLDHHQEGERERLDLMSRLLDPMHRRHLDQAGLEPGARTLEVGCGNGSMSAWLAGQVAPSGRAVAVDLDLSLADAGAPALELRQADIVAGPVPPGNFDLVTCRAVLHHLGDPAAAALFNGGSLWAEYWRLTVTQLRPRLEESGELGGREIDTFLRQCADPAWWTQVIAFTAVHGRTPLAQKDVAEPAGLQP